MFGCVPYQNELLEFIIDLGVQDNRVTAHSAVPDYGSEFRRHAVRLTPQAEVPTEGEVNA